VKDWRLETIVSADKGNVELLTSRGIVRESHPLEQARKYTFDVVRTLERDGQLLFPPGHRLMGKSIVPFGSAPYSRTSRAGNSIKPNSVRCSPSTCVCSRMK
jgi:hypothetical protein